MFQWDFIVQIVIEKSVGKDMMCFALFTIATCTYIRVSTLNVESVLIHSMMK